jgi:hypothetical protein
MVALLGPTPQRLSHAVECDEPLIDTKARRQCFRIIGVVEMMHRRGSIRDEALDAFKIFEMDLSHAYASGALVSRYGELTGSTRTPLSQLASHLLGPEKRAQAHARLADAARYVGEPRTLETLLALALREATLEQIGRDVLMVGNKAQAIAVASRTVQMGTYSLAIFYGKINPAREPPA